MDTNRTSVLGTAKALFFHLLAKVSIKAMDAVGHVLGMDADGRPISQQSDSDLTERLQTLARLLQDPKNVEHIKVILSTAFREFEPIVAEQLKTISALVMELVQENAEKLPRILAEVAKAVPWIGSILAIGSAVNHGTELFDDVVQKTDQIYNSVAKGAVDSRKAYDRVNAEMVGGEAQKRAPKKENHRDVKARIDASIKQFRGGGRL